MFVQRLFPCCYYWQMSQDIMVNCCTCSACATSLVAASMRCIPSWRRVMAALVSDLRASFMQESRSLYRAYRKSQNAPNAHCDRSQAWCKSCVSETIARALMWVTNAISIAAIQLVGPAVRLTKPAVRLATCPSCTTSRRLKTLLMHMNSQSLLCGSTMHRAWQ